VNSLVHIQDGTLIGSGDDDGIIKIWDLRIASKKSSKLGVMEFQENEGTITDMAVNKNKNLLLASR
jgi:WD40 repeat protein